MVRRTASAQGGRDLDHLLAALAPAVRPVPYVVVETVADVVAAAVIVEDEATTKIIEQTAADAHGLPPCNVLAASRHDHLLVPWHSRDDAVAILSALAD